MKYLICVFVLVLGVFGSYIIYQKLECNYVLGAERTINLANEKIWDDILKAQKEEPNFNGALVEKSVLLYLGLYDIKLIRGSELLFHNDKTTSVKWSKWGQTGSYDYLGNRYYLSIKPTKKYLNVLTSQVPILILVFGCILSFVLSILILFVQYYYERSEDLNKAKKEISETNQILIQKNHELEQYVYAASHDLQEPINTILSFLEILEEDHGRQLKNESIRQYLGYIENASKQMKILVEGLLTHGQIGRGEEKTIVEINAILEETVNDLTHRIKKSQAEVIIPKPLPKVVGYRMELKRLFQNLLSNAIKYQRENVIPVVKIISKPNKKSWHFIIQDNGIGIDSKNKDKIFDLFQRLHHKSKYQGTGIGLAHCKKIIELHKGKIWVDSELNKGSEFHIILPK